MGLGVWGFEVWWVWERCEDAVVEGREMTGTSEAGL